MKSRHLQPKKIHQKLQVQLCNQLLAFCKYPRNANLLRFLFCVAVFNLFATTHSSSQSNPPEKFCEACAIPGVSPQTYITGKHAVIYAGRMYDPVECRTYFLYCAVNDGGSGGQDISHTTFGDPNCANTCLESMSLSTLVGDSGLY